jgi:hypothetical protein
VLGIVLTLAAVLGVHIILRRTLTPLRLLQIRITKEFRVILGPLREATFLQLLANLSKQRMPIFPKRLS